MKYIGSKRRLAKYILPIMLAERKEGQTWVEPFVGGANLIEKVDGVRIGADNNKYLIAYLKKIQEGWVPNRITEDEYKVIKENMVSYPPEVVGFALVGCSFSGLWASGYAKPVPGRQDYVGEAIRNAIKQGPKLKGIDFRASGYEELNIPENSFIYCDPPYQSSTPGCYLAKKFDSEKFFGWCRKMALAGHTVFVSESKAPEDFKLIWENQIALTLVKQEGIVKPKRIERLYKVEG